MPKCVLTLTFVALGWLAACTEPPRSGCGAPFECADLLQRVCGTDDACAASADCRAARRLDADGDAAVCQTAWCNLGESYAACE